MALDKATLKSDLETIFNEQADVPVHPHTDASAEGEEPPPEESKSFATLVCDAVDKYLAGIECAGYAGATVNSTTSLAGDDGDPTQKIEPVPPVTADKFRTEFKARCQSHYDSHAAQSFSSCAAELQADLQTFTANKSSAGTGTGTTTAPNTLDLDAAFDKGIAGESHSAVAQEFADQIHAVTTATSHKVNAFTVGTDAGVGPDFGGGNLE